MPPVAEDFADVIERLRREGAGGMTTWRKLAKRLNEIDRGRQSTENWRGTINRYRRREITPEEDTIKLFAAAFERLRDEFPESQSRQQLKLIRAEVEALRRQVQEHEKRLELLEPETEQREKRRLPEESVSRPRRSARS